CKSSSSGMYRSISSTSTSAHRRPQSGPRRAEEGGAPQAARASQPLSALKVDDLLLDGDRLLRCRLDRLSLGHPGVLEGLTLRGDAAESPEEVLGARHALSRGLELLVALRDARGEAARRVAHVRRDDVPGLDELAGLIVLVARIGFDLEDSREEFHFAAD